MWSNRVKIDNLVYRLSNLERNIIYVTRRMDIIEQRMERIEKGGAKFTDALLNHLNITSVTLPAEESKITFVKKGKK